MHYSQTMEISTKTECLKIVFMENTCQTVVQLFIGIQLALHGPVAQSVRAQS